MKFVIPSKAICNPIVATIKPVMRMSAFMKLYFVRKLPIPLALSITSRFNASAPTMEMMVITLP